MEFGARGCQTRPDHAWDRSPGEIVWSKDGKTIYAGADSLGQHSLFASTRRAAR
jgi:hypothetical protein